METNKSYWQVLRENFFQVGGSAFNIIIVLACIWFIHVDINKGRYVGVFLDIFVGIGLSWVEGSKWWKSKPRGEVTWF